MRFNVATVFGTAITMVMIATVVVISAKEGEHGNIGSGRGVQSEIDSLQHQMVEKIQEIEEDYAHRRVPVYQKRNALLSEVPGFWKRAMSNHPNFGQISFGVDRDIIEHLRSVDVEDVTTKREADGTEVNVPISSGSGKYYVKLSFEPNQYFTDTKLWRLVDSYSTDPTSAEVSGINWLPGKRPNEQASFFNFFEKPSSGGTHIDHHRMLDIAHYLRYELYTNPFTYYDIPTYADIADEEARRREEALTRGQEDEEHFTTESNDGANVGHDEKSEEAKENL